MSDCSHVRAEETKHHLHPAEPEAAGREGDFKETDRRAEQRTRPAQLDHRSHPPVRPLSSEGALPTER